MMEIRTDANGRKYEYHEESAKHKTELDRLRAEVASLKEQLQNVDVLASSLHHDKESLTQQLSAANGRLGKLENALSLAIGMIWHPDNIALLQAALSDLPEADKEKS